MISLELFLVEHFTYKLLLYVYLQISQALSSYLFDLYISQNVFFICTIKFNFLILLVFNLENNYVMKNKVLHFYLQKLVFSFNSYDIKNFFWYFENNSYVNLQIFARSMHMRINFRISRNECVTQCVTQRNQGRVKVTPPSLKIWIHDLFEKYTWHRKKNRSSAFLIKLILF